MNELYTWDLTSMYADDAAQEADAEAVKAMFPKLAEFSGKLAEGPEVLADALDLIGEAARKMSNVYVYAHLKNDQDATNSTYQEMYAKATQLYGQFGETVAYFEPELNTIPEATLTQFIDENDRLKHYQQHLDNMGRGRAHVLPQEQELLLAQASEVFQGASNTFGLLNNADLVFPTIKDEEGKEVQLTHSLYSKFLESSDRRVRKETFEKFYSVYDQFKNTMASILSTSIKVNNYDAKVHKFESARQAALFTNNIPESVYDTLVDTVNKRLDLLHRYVGLRKELLGLEDLEMYDMYTPLLGDAPIKMTYEEAKSITLEALAPLGEEYLAIMREAFEDRWIDLYENKGKRSGAYSSGTYDSKPYILMNWQDNVNWLYTLVHELGHSAHSYLTHKNQPYTYGSYSIFLAEIASTTNENLLTAYLLDKYEDPQVRLYIINHFLDGMKGTVYRQTQFAEFEHFMYQSDAAGQPLTQQFLSDNYRELNRKYYGEAVNSDSEIALEWSRIPHFYYNYYVFQYATGFSAATAFSKAILEGQEGALDKYLGYLKAGRSQYPIDIIKTAGLDMTQSDYIDAALDVFEQRLNEFEALLKENK
ncbi:oligoendopeptidase F [Globicatella sanguinis]|uniref:oligoendopeptidase F n=1 Tax=Globicatella sanguinis TaxID=13076 RepID=UPI0025435CB3|nr:oligoendopeptidase F [Globicatella sanguinis]MDK7630985.1 oligoendopeptidase F [Globicatella sanguinis]WIK67619.1 oligoendopeptidase F [Globicatella sanguinis]WKT57024.1 oligoendopeptidase F [Globicatella sanguinis]